MAAPFQNSPNQASTGTTKVKSASSTKDEPTTTITTTEISQVDAPATLKDPPPVAPVAAAAAVDDNFVVGSSELTYHGTQTSDAYLLAKRYLASGNFDLALDTISHAMECLLESLPCSSSKQAQVHPAMAPLYYLYGTTLLYSMEEEEETTTLHPSTNNNMMMMRTPTTDNNNHDNDDDHDDENDDDNDIEEQPDDIQIAWENLESARFILQTMMMDNNGGDDDIDHPTTDNNITIPLDLAQVHVRLGDLQMANSHYANATKEYMESLQLRYPILGMYHRKVAELYHLLGVSYLMLATTTSTTTTTTTISTTTVPQETHDNDDDEMSNQTSFHPTITTTTTSQQEKQQQEYRRLSIQYYVACAKSFAGQIALLCGKDPDQVVAVDPPTTTTTDLSSSSLSRGKTTGMDESELAKMQEELESSSSSCNNQFGSHVIRVLRERVQDMYASLLEQDQKDKVMECKELLDEIQETIDEAETSAQGIKEVVEMKHLIQQQVASASAASHEEGDAMMTIHADGSTTQIGFGTTASTSVPITAMAIPTMMVVKKKKNKRNMDEQTLLDSKMPANEQQGNVQKRVKTRTSKL